MRNRLLMLSILLTLALLSAACSAQNTTSEPGATTTLPTATTEAEAATQEATEAVTEAAGTPTGGVEAGTPDQATAETGTTSTASTNGSTPAPEAGGTAGIPQTGLGDAGLPDDVDEVIRVLRETGVTVQLGDAVEADFVSVPGQILLIDDEEVEIYTFDSAEELEAQASRLADQDDPEDEPQFYKMGNMLVRYAGSDTLVRDLLEDVLGAQAAGQ